MSNNVYAYSEIFDSIQGEGEYTGYPTAWLRFYLCNLQCNGFSKMIQQIQVHTNYHTKTLIL